MILTPLWHTEFLLDIENNEGKNVRFLVDSWLSDFVIGDLCERSVKVELDTEKLSTIDAIYLSHAHTDHIDPYTLIEIYQHANPLLLLPVTLRFLEPIFRQYIPQIEIQFLKNREIFQFHGIDIQGIYFDNTEITNEDDVMAISFAGDSEILFAEIDTVPPETPEAYKLLTKIFSRKKYETIAYIASRNELEGNIRALDAKSVKDRANIVREYLHTRKEDIEFGYEKWEYEDFAEFENFFELDGFVRGFVGQGLIYPTVLSTELAGINIFPLAEVVDREVQIAANFGYHFPQKALLPGRQYRLTGGDIETGRKECPIGVLKTQNEKSKIDTEVFKKFASGPLFPSRTIDLEKAKSEILEVLNSRFLPYFSASPVASLRSALIGNPDGAYRIEFKVSPTESIFFEYSFASEKFGEVPYTEKIRIDEDYWLSDILDFLDGRQELYSQFWHTLAPKRAYRLWMCLGANFCNNDLILNKYRLHFERAKNGETAQGFFQTMTQHLS